MKEKIDSITIVGGGPAGLKTAIELLDKGFEGQVILFEEDKEIGKPVHCAGLVSLNYINILNQNIPKELIVNKVKGARIFFPHLKDFTVGRNHYVAVVIDREKLDKYLAEQALAKGAHLIKGVKVCEIDVKKRKALLSNRKIHYFKTLVIASGIKDKLVKKLGFGKLKGRLPALQWDMEGVRELNPEIVEVYLGNRFSKGLFAWIIPLDDRKARVGVATLGDPLSRLLYMIKQHPLLSHRFSHARRIRTYGGAVVTLGARKEIVRENIALIGDVAGQTKPTTGGGLYYLSLAASYLSDAILMNNLNIYEKLWKRNMGMELKTQLILRLFLNNLSDETLVKLYQFLKDMNFKELASTEGDMDFQAKVIIKTLLHGLKNTLLHPQIYSPLMSALLNAIFWPS